MSSAIFGKDFFTPEMMSRVETLPFFRITIRADRCPSTRTMLVCGGYPSRTLANHPLPLSHAMRLVALWAAHGTPKMPG
jgi:hypothetical protein